MSEKVENPQDIERGKCRSVVRWEPFAEGRKREAAKRKNWRKVMSDLNCRERKQLEEVEKGGEKKSEKKAP